MIVYTEAFEKHLAKIIAPFIYLDPTKEFKLKSKSKIVKMPVYSKSKKSGFTLKSGTTRMLEPKEDALKLMFQNLQEFPTIRYHISEEKIAKFDLFHHHLIHSQFVVVVHWIYKKRWNPKHKIPANRVLVKNLEPLGDLYVSLLDLCNAVYELETILGFQCIGYVLWFEKIILEIRHSELRVRLPNIENIKTKEEGYKEDYKVLEKIKNFKNPINKTTQPNYHNLLEKAFYLIKTKRYENLEKNQWKNFINAYSNYLKSTKTYKYAGCTDGESYYFAKKRGKNIERHRINLS